MFRFEELIIWKSAIEYGNKLYAISSKFPKEETFALANQLRRAAVSISNNIAEGSGGSARDFAKFLNIAVKSTLETVNILYIAESQGYISNQERSDYYKQAEVLIRQIRAFKKSLSI